MRLWSEQLLKVLPRQQLISQHRECAALRGLGWGKPHSTVNYVFKHDPYKLYLYHEKVMIEMIRRKNDSQIDSQWFDPAYRGKICEPYDVVNMNVKIDKTIYPEHDKSYVKECIDNLIGKGIDDKIILKMQEVYDRL